jgi:hypothetical protein
MGTKPHIPAETFSVEWQVAPTADKHKREFFRLSQADAEAYRLARRMPDARVWLCGAVIQHGRGFDAVT